MLWKLNPKEKRVKYLDWDNDNSGNSWYLCLNAQLVYNNTLISLILTTSNQIKSLLVKRQNQRAWRETVKQARVITDKLDLLVMKWLFLLPTKKWKPEMHLLSSAKAHVMWCPDTAFHRGRVYIVGRWMLLWLPLSQSLSSLDNVRQTKIGVPNILPLKPYSQSPQLSARSAHIVQQQS